MEFPREIVPKVVSEWQKIKEGQKFNAKMIISAKRSWMELENVSKVDALYNFVKLMIIVQMTDTNAMNKYVLYWKNVEQMKIVDQDLFVKMDIVCLKKKGNVKKMKIVLMRYVSFLRLFVKLYEHLF